MAIVEMSKLKLVGLGVERDKILNALAKTSLVELKECEKLNNTHFLCEKGDLAQVEGKLSSVADGVEVLTKRIERQAKQKGVNTDGLKDGFEVDFDGFICSVEREVELLAVCEQISGLVESIADASAEKLRLQARKKSLAPYLGISGKFSDFAPTRYAEVILGSVPSEKIREFRELVANSAIIEAEELCESVEQSAVAVAFHKDNAEQALAALGGVGFMRCTFTEDSTAAELNEECGEGISLCERTAAECEKQILGFADRLRDLKILADRYGFEIEKLKAAEKFPQTEKTFVLEGYLPKESQERVREAILSVSDTAYFEFEGIADGETPPTLTRNNKVVKNFEFVTNMYTPPTYREFDPNAIMSIFFSIFMGFIMADVGYGLLMMLGFVIASRQKRDTGMKRLMLVIGYGGIFTVIFGLLFSSFFGFSATPGSNNQFAIGLLPKAIIPDAQTHMSTLAGISLPTVLLIALGMGVVQLIASNLCKAYSLFREGKILDGIFIGVVWAIFLVGLIMLVLGFIEGIGTTGLVIAGGVTAGASVVVGACTAGINEKGFGKVVKGFTAVYGIINYMSDILSYARLYGLMLSGAIIAQIASGQGFQLVVSGNVVMAVVGVLVMIIGHAFNLAMGVLGAYIHDARLQYIEFFSRFYEGEGELFAPLGSKRKYVYLKASPSLSKEA